MKKICSKCKIEKELCFFHKNKRSKDGLDFKCNDCKTIYRKEYYKKNKDKEIENNKKYTTSHAAQISARHKQYRLDNKQFSEKLKLYYQQYYQKNITLKRTQGRQYYQNHTAERKAYIKSYNRRRAKEDIMFRLVRNLRKRLWDALMNNCKSITTLQSLGCSVENLKSWIEQQFQPGMSWDNYGNGEGKWNVDHIIPLSKFDLSDHAQLLKACHWFNLQPLWAVDNIKKGNKITKL